jgi:hypothetical protein
VPAGTAADVEAAVAAAAAGDSVLTPPASAIRANSVSAPGSAEAPVPTGKIPTFISTC